MCFKPFEYYEPPNRTKSPSSILPSIYERLRSHRTSLRLSEDPSIKSKLSLISSDNIKKSIERLSSFHNRHSKSQNIDSVADWIKNELINIGYNNNNVTFHGYSESGFSLKNVICNKKGTTDKIILLCAH